VSGAIEVDPARLDRWIDGFSARHGDATCVRRPGCVVLTGADGTRVVGETFEHERIGLVLVRRGGHAVGRDVGGELVSHTCGTGYVQGRTKAGGWSQQRYARRRGNQADAVVAKVVGLALRHLPKGAVEALVLGGDRRLAEEVLKEPALAHLAPLPRRTLWDLPDPRLRVLQHAARRARAVRLRFDQE